MTFSFKRCNWKSTLWVNFIRAVAAGAVWFIIVLINGTQSGKPDVMSKAIMVGLFFPLAYFLFYMPIGMIMIALIKHFEWLGIIALIFAIMIWAGDPIIWLLRKIKPELVPVEKYGFVNKELFIFVIDE